MKLLRYDETGSEKPGLLDADGTIRDLSAHVADIAGTALHPATLEMLSRLDPKSLPAVSGSPRMGACVAGTGKFICIGLNYSDHAAETGATVPSEPIIFMKASSAIVGPDGKDYEAVYTLELQPDGVWRITGVSLRASNSLST